MICDHRELAPTLDALIECAKLLYEETDGIADEMSYAQIDRSNEIYVLLITLPRDIRMKISPHLKTGIEMEEERCAH